MALVLLGGLAWFFTRPAGEGRSKSSSEAQGVAKGGKDRPVPVNVSRATLENVPLYLEGLGNVAAFNTVTVRSQVDGRIDRVAFREGQEVHRGDLLAEIDPRPFQNGLHRAEATLARDSAQLKNAKLNLARYLQLRDQHLVAQQQVDDQQAAVDQAEAGVALDEAQVADARLQLAYAHITSPIEGRTGLRQIDPGNLVHAGDTNGLVVITQLDPIAVLFTLPEDELGRVFAEMARGPLTVEALSRDGATVLGTGELALVDNQINASTGTIRLKAVFPNPERKLWPNQFVKARLLLETKKDALVIPVSAIQRGPSGTFAYVVGGDNKAKPQPVEVELTASDRAVIASGLSPGDRVVTDGQYRLTPGALVDVRSPEHATTPKTASAARGGEPR